MKMKKRAERRKKTGGKTIAEQVRTLAASRLIEDEIASRLGIHKNELRAKYIDAIKRGKAKAAASELQIAGMRREELHALNAILVCFADDDWIDDGRSLLWGGCDGGGAKSAAEAFAKWQLEGGRFICAGRNSNFGPERLKEFAVVKAAAQKLLKQRR